MLPKYRYIAAFVLTWHILLKKYLFSPQVPGHIAAILLIRRRQKDSHVSSAFPFSKELDYGVFRIAYRHSVRHYPVSTASGFPAQTGCLRRFAPALDSYPSAGSRHRYQGSFPGRNYVRGRACLRRAFLRPLCGSRCSLSFPV